MRVKIRRDVLQHFRNLSDEAFAQLPDEVSVEGTPIISMPTGEGVAAADIQRKLAQGWLAFRKKLSELIYTPKP
jgi:hypothetical protein